ncbi:hypothetical protein VNI00_012315 [Paramarasmius palmivorus]|uniref:non-reducing end alpha-L-arabinofuranosidase n=1 Tax=Paramarasmius palmivorus TaxID=297713 RepID=A0AAW0C5G5_9AGAR
MLRKFSQLSLLLAVGVALVGAQTTVTIEAEASHSIPTTLWGMMFEDISHVSNPTFSRCTVSYAGIEWRWWFIRGTQLLVLRNRAFQLVTPGTSASLAAWQAVNGAEITVVADSNPVSDALPNSLALTVPDGASGSVGVANEGFWGIKVSASSQYNASFFYRFPEASDFSGDATVSLQSLEGETLGSATIELSGSQTTWTQVFATFTPESDAANTNNTFVVSVDGAAAAGQTIHFALFSLFPPTFNNRPNGMRADIAEAGVFLLWALTALAEMGPKVWRFPGGNNLEVTSAYESSQGSSDRFIRIRPGRQGDWGYINTDGLGIYEYLLWCEDLDAEPIMGIYSGYSLQGMSIPEDELGPYIQQAADQINFVIGDPAESEAAALRASLGHPEPFNLRRVEVGNEDFFAPDTYTYRWPAFVNALQEQFPDLAFMATTDVNDPVLTPKPAEYDVHVYQTPKWFSDNAFFYDDFERDGTLYFEGEYAAISLNSSDIFGSPATGRLLFPTMQSASGEAAFMTGLERNSDIVFAAAYAPLLNHIENTQWTPNLVSFDAGTVYRSTSFYVQKLFSHNRGDEYLPSTLPERGGTVHWAVARRGSNEIIIKVANAGDSAHTLTFSLPFDTIAESATVELLVGNGPSASNNPTTPNAVAPQNSTISAGQTFDFEAPPFSFGVITLTAE